jgi:uncharacterized protein (TIGR02996 family)
VRLRSGAGCVPARVSYTDGMATTADGVALLRTILEQPGDDAARLVYSDWLEEQGNADLAEFVRVQCALAKYGPRSADVLYHETLGRRGKQCDDISCELCDLNRRERELWAAALVIILDTAKTDLPNTVVAYRSGEHPEFLPPGPAAYVRRGFVDEVRCSLADWQAHGPTIVTQQPVTRVTLTDRRPVGVGSPDGDQWFFMFGNAQQIQEGDTVLPAAWHDDRPGPPPSFPTAEAAVAYASRLGVNWARSAAGLPPLT